MICDKTIQIYDVTHCQALLLMAFDVFAFRSQFPRVCPRDFCGRCTLHGSVGIATRYELDGPGIESRWERGLNHPSRPVLGPTQPPVQWVPGHSRWVKRPGRGVDHPPPSSAEVKERVELYIYSPSGLSWSVLGRPLPFIEL
jgi:hypothetical protein